MVSAQEMLTACDCLTGYYNIIIYDQLHCNCTSASDQSDNTVGPIGCSFM